MAFFCQKSGKRLFVSSVLEELVGVNVFDEFFDDLADDLDRDNVRESLALDVVSWMRVLGDIIIDQSTETVQSFFMIPNLIKKSKIAKRSMSL